MAEKKRSDMVDVSPQEAIRRMPGESDADVKKRAAAEKAAVTARMNDTDEASRFYKARDKVGSDVGARLELDTIRAMGKRFSKGGSVKSSASKRGDGIAQKGKTRGKIC